MRLPRVTSAKDIVHLVDEIGFLPYFQTSIPGFSLEDCIAPRYWFSGEEGAWEWKGPVIQASGCAYGKFLQGKACFVSRTWFPDFANLRRQGYDMDALYDDGYARKDDLDVWQLLASGPLLTDELKRAGGFRKGGRKGFEEIITRLQAECYVVIADFAYRRDKNGEPYGWGVARYDTPEHRFGADFTEKVYLRTPEESEERLLAHLCTVIPARYRSQLTTLLRKGCAKL